MKKPSCPNPALIMLVIMIFIILSFFVAGTLSKADGNKQKNQLIGLIENVSKSEMKVDDYHINKIKNSDSERFKNAIIVPSAVLSDKESISIVFVYLPSKDSVDEFDKYIYKTKLKELLNSKEPGELVMQDVSLRNVLFSSTANKEIRKEFHRQVAFYNLEKYANLTIIKKLTPLISQVKENMANIDFFSDKPIIRNITLTSNY